ncbi:hypothetical protein C8R46DRAFT_139013 [Mycena filopes]|nr:hypothetical protein C8R46DRAFT_139013 [Mycena filopes]
MAALTVEVHSLTEQVPRPPQISEIIRVLGLPLPISCAALLPRTIFPPSPGPGQHHADSAPPVADVANLALSTASYIRSLVENYGPSRSALPFLSSLIQVLVSMCAKDAVLLKEAAFVRPRTTTLKHGVDGVATMLACHIVESLAKEDGSAMDQGFCDAMVEESNVSSQPDTRPMNVDSEGEQFRSASSSRSSSSQADGTSSLDPDVYPMNVDSESIQSSAGPSSIDVAVDAHILPGHGRHLCALLPLLCIAHRDTIVDLMTSTACQRFVWGITEPVVGLVVDDSATVASLVLSWLDPDTHVVHIASASEIGPKHNPVLGSFDFTDPVQTLTFCQFILNLSHHFAIISERATACENNSLDWRSDNKQKASEDFGSSEDRVLQWVRHVQISSGKSHSLPPTPPSSPPARASRSPPSSRSARGSSSLMSRDMSQSRQSGGRTIPKSPAGPQSTASSKKSKKSNTAWSCSAYAAQSTPDSIDDFKKGNITTWMFDRLAFTIARIEFPNPQNSEQLEINRMIREYDDICGFRNIPWDETTLLPVDKVVAGAKDVLIRQLIDMRSKAEKPVAQAKEIKTVPVEHAALISGRLSALLSATTGAHTLNAKKHLIKVYEAESRHDWDTLLYHFYHGSDDGVSHNILLEHSLHLARNILADGRDDRALTEQLQRYQQHCYDSYGAAVPPGVASALVKRQAFVALSQASTFEATLQKMLESKRSTDTGIANRSFLEPREGKCDVILFIAVKNTYNAGKDVILRHIDAKDKRPVKRSTSDIVVEAEVTEEDRVTYLQDPFRVTANLPTSSGAKIPLVVDPILREGLLLPHFTGEYKKPDDIEGKALNQGRMYLVSVVAFYSAIGIENRPFYCLVTTGTVGTILMGWKSSKHGQTYIMERNTVKYDIASPIEASQFAAFLLRLHDDAGRLTDLVQTTLDSVEPQDRPALLERLKAWRKVTQNPKMKRIPETPETQTTPGATVST